MTVAASAGVSVATVSKVLNNRRDVSPATRALVHQLLEQHDYVRRRPDSASTIAAAVRPTVELIFDGEINVYGVEVLQGVLDAGAAAGVAVVVARRHSGTRTAAAERRATWAQELVASGRRAVIAVVDELTAADAAALARVHLPLVVIDPLDTPSARVTSVGATNFAGGLAATTHLVTLGHENIAFVGGDAAAACNQARMQGYRAAMEAAGLPTPARYVRTGRFHYDCGLAEGAALLDLAEPPTAVFAANDEIALGVFEAARSTGRRIPSDLSIVGFDDTEVARLASPPLTTIRQPLREIGGVALRTALRLSAGETLESHHIELATELVLRQSTARVPGAPGRGPTIPRGRRPS